MIKLVSVKWKPDSKRIGVAEIHYYDLVMYCDVVVYKKEKIWIRMPEVWKDGVKAQSARWKDRSTTNVFQAIFVKEIIERTGIDMKKALHLKAKGIQRVSKKPYKKKFFKKKTAAGDAHVGQCKA